MDRRIDWLTDLPIDRPIDWPIDWLGNWLTDAFSLCPYSFRYEGLGVSHIGLSELVEPIHSQDDLDSQAGDVGAEQVLVDLRSVTLQTPEKRGHGIPGGQKRRNTSATGVYTELSEIFSAPLQIAAINGPMNWKPCTRIYYL